MIRNNKLYFMLVAVMFLIAAALGIAMLVKPSSQASTQPAAEPLYWHVMGDKAHMSLRANFVSKTEQTFRLDIWLPHGVGAPVQAQVKAAPENGTAGAAVEVPIVFKNGGPDPYGFEGFDKYTYESAKGPYLNAPGDWKLIVDVKDANHQQYPYEKTVQIR